MTLDRAIALRAAWIILGAAVLALGLGYVVQSPVATATWPWPDGRLSYVFVGSILVAAAVSFLWVGATGEQGAMAGGALTGLVAGSGGAAYLFGLVAGDRRSA